MGPPQVSPSSPSHQRPASQPPIGALVGAGSKDQIRVPLSQPVRINYYKPLPALPAVPQLVDPIGRWWQYLMQAADMYEWPSEGRTGQQLLNSPNQWMSHEFSAPLLRQHATHNSLQPRQRVEVAKRILQQLYLTRSVELTNGQEIWENVHMAPDQEQPGGLLMPNRLRDLRDQDLLQIEVVCEEAGFELYGSEEWDPYTHGACPSSCKQRRDRQDEVLLLQQGRHAPSIRSWWPKEHILLLALREIVEDLDQQALQDSIM